MINFIAMGLAVASIVVGMVYEETGFFAFAVGVLIGGIFFGEE